MSDKNQGRDQLNEELTRLRQRLAELEKQVAEEDETKQASPGMNAQLRAMIQAFDGYLYVCSQDFRIEFMNERLIERTGYDGTGDFCYKVLHERDSVCPWCVNERVFRGETVRWEIRSPKDNRWFYVVNTPIYNDDGTISKQSMMIDITDRKRTEEALRQAHDDLERTVEKRTAELVTKNRELTRIIEENVRTQEALRESEERYRGVVDHIGIGVAVISPNMRILTLNNRMRKWFPDIDISERPICYKVFNSPPCETVCSYCPTFKTLQDGQVREAVTKTPSGNDIINYRIVSSPIKDKHGKIIAAIEMVEDITENKRMQDRLQESEGKYRTIFETTTSPTLIVEENTTISLVNTEFEKISGYSKEEVEGKKSWTEFVVKDDLSRLLEYQQLRRMNPQAAPRTYEFRVIDRAGRIRDVFMTVGMIPGTRKSVASFLDITERKQVEEALKQANAYLANVFENSPDPIGIVDRHGKFIMWNKMAEELYGYSFEELRGKSAFDLYADTDQLRGMLKHLRQEGSVNRWEMQMKRKDGSIVPCELSIGLLLDHEHRTLGSVCVARDLREIKKVLAELQASNEKLRQEVAERMLAEQELSKYRDHLKDLVQERTRELAKTNEQLTREIEERKRVEEALKEASEKLKLFAYSVAHDLKSPAVGIYGLTRRLHKQYRDLIDEKGRNYCDQILKAAEHVAALVEKVNLFIETKEARLSIERINFRDILRMIKEEFSSQLSLRQIDWLEPETMIEINADRLSLVRVLRNLVDNSLKYGGERLSRICIGYEEAADFHIFSVTDNGRGLKEEDAEGIFRPFQRPETSKGVEGAGLGLTIVKEIAEQHGGKVWVESRSQKGTTFSLSISKYCATE